MRLHSPLPVLAPTKHGGLVFNDETPHAGVSVQPLYMLSLKGRGLTGEAGHRVLSSNSA